MVDLSTDKIIVTVDRFVTTSELRRAYKEWNDRREEQTRVSHELGLLRTRVHDILKSDKHAEKELQTVMLMKNQLKCPICCSFMSDIILMVATPPFLTPPSIQECGHVFCRTCLVQWEQSLETMSCDSDDDSDEYEPQLTCPLCRTDVFLPVSREPTLRFFVRLLSGVELAMEPHHAVDLRLKNQLYIPVPPQRITQRVQTKGYHAIASYLLATSRLQHGAVILPSDSDVIASTFDLLRQSTRSLVHIIQIQKGERHVLEILLTCCSASYAAYRAELWASFLKCSDADTLYAINAAQDLRNAFACSAIHAQLPGKYSC
ncbi:hypothetical protein CVT26_001425 [Gymnopilus dilepis]|uniref:RING-type domain-containing protein n=1 Tax=Gymnopilus dilepis TaxID=231916 RepID=A0A409W7F4_9AGAR|nr:hypothetical protein CVT26_001425 [Gymnopilus dilepis]